MQYITKVSTSVKYCGLFLETAEQMGTVSLPITMLWGPLSARKRPQSQEDQWWAFPQNGMHCLIVLPIRYSPFSAVHEPVSGCFRFYDRNDTHKIESCKEFKVRCRWWRLETKNITLYRFFMFSHFLLAFSPVTFPSRTRSYKCDD